MGLFSSKRRTYVGTAVSRVIQDNGLPNSVKTGTLKAIFNNGDVPEYILEELVGSVGLRADKYYEYGNRYYTHGLPSGEFYSYKEGVPEVQAVLDALEGQPVFIEYCNFAPLNVLHLGWIRLIEQLGYNPATNQVPAISTAQGKTCWLQDMQVQVPSGTLGDFRPGALDHWGVSPNSGVTPTRPSLGGSVGSMRAHTGLAQVVGLATPRVAVVSVFEQSSSFSNWDGNVTPSLFSTRTDYINLPEAVASNEGDYFNVKYTVNGVVKYWLYEHGTGVYPTLDGVFDPAASENGNFFPFAYFRFNSVSESSNTGSQSYITTKKLVKKLGLDYDTIEAGINANPDIDDVVQAMMTFAVPANTTNQLELRYLYDFFDGMAASQGAATRQFVPENTYLNPDRQGAFATVISDRRFTMVLSNDGIIKKRRFGSIGAIGSHSTTTSSETFTSRITQFNGEFDSVSTVSETRQYRHYRRQVSANLYDELLVQDLKMQYKIISGYQTTGDENDPILLIPIDRSISRLYSIREREELYTRSLHFVFNSVQVVKVKWYQTGFFQFLLLVAAVVISVLSLGADGGALIAAALAGSTIAIQTILLQLLLNVVIGFALKLFVKAVGAEAAFIIAIVAFLVAGVNSFDAGSVAGAPWAKELLQLSSGLTGAIKDSLGDAFKDLQNEYTSFGLFADEASKSLEAANKLLENNNYLSPFVIFGEKPEDFYNRTIHSGNIGVASIGAISSYVETALTLPKLNESVGESV